MEKRKQNVRKGDNINKLPFQPENLKIVTTKNSIFQLPS